MRAAPGWRVLAPVVLQTVCVRHEPPGLAGRGGRAFSQGRFFEAQTLWEAEARGASPATRALIEGLATVAAGMLAHDEQRLETAERLLTGGAAALAFAPAMLDDVDVASVRITAEMVASQLRREPGGGPRLVLSAS